MVYAEVEDVMNHLNVYAIASLTDDEENKAIVESVVEECLMSASDFTDTVLPARLLSNFRTARYITLEKTIALLYRRYGHNEDAESHERALAQTIQNMVSASQESGRTKYDHNTRYHSEAPLFSNDTWKNAVIGRKY